MKRYVLRIHDNNGPSVGWSTDGTTFISEDGQPFAERTGDDFRLADGREGVLRGSSVYSTAAGEENDALFWLDEEIRAS